MVPVTHTTYGVAMGHRPRTLAESGGLLPTGTGRTRDRTASGELSRATSWFDAVPIRSCDDIRWLVLRRSAHDDSGIGVSVR